jgi:hypothetical protein
MKKMKVMRYVSSILALLIMIVSCATMPRVLPEKYNFDNYLEEVKRISTSRVSDLENVDNQSVILRASLRAGCNNYYLLVLSKPIETTHLHVDIAVENTAAKDRAYSTQKILSEKWLRKDKDAEVQILRTHRFDIDSQ